MKFSWIVRGFLCLALGLSLVSCEFDPPAAEDGIDFGYLPQISNNAASTRSFSCWVYVHGHHAASEVFLGAFADNAGFILSVTDNNEVSYYQKGVGAPGNWLTAVNSLTLNTWTNIIVTRDASVAANVPIIYIGGVDQAPLNEVSAQGGVTAPEEGVHFFIGNVKTAAVDWAWPMDGLIKDVRVYNRILTGVEAASLAAGGDETQGLIFQSPCVRTNELSDFEDLTLTADLKMIDNIYGFVGTPHDAVITRLIP